jgi:hypothetical protein
LLLASARLVSEFRWVFLERRVVKGWDLGRRKHAESGSLAAPPVSVSGSRAIAPASVSGSRMTARLVLALALPLCATACVASSSAVQNTKAARAVEHAKRARAAEAAPYEFTLAQAYLDKAREEASEAAYQDANRLARKSQENAAKAVDRARQSTSSGGR